MKNFDFGLCAEYSHEINEIRKWAKDLRNLRESLDFSWIHPVDWELKWSNIHGKPTKSLTITLTPSGCKWIEHGGCTMCGEYEGSTKGKSISPEFHMAQFAKAISDYYPLYHPEWLRIYQEGNYVNPQEVEENIQIAILRLASSLTGIKRITIESMAKYITNENAKELRKAVPEDIELEIGMGFEGEDDVVRNVCVNKGETIEDYERAISILKDNNIRSLGYVVLKPPFLTEQEAIEEAILTINRGDELGFDALSLQPLTIHKYSLAHALYSVKEYELPWLWSVIEVAKHIKNIEDFRIGGLGFYPRPINAAYNRHKGYHGDDCNPVLWKLIKEYGKTRDKSIFDGLECACKKQWLEVCNQKDTDLHKRIKNKLAKLDLDLYKKQFQNNDDIFPNMISIEGDTFFNNM